MKRLSWVLGIVFAFTVLAGPVSARTLHYWIHVTKNGSGSGYVKGESGDSNSTLVDCGETCTGSYPTGGVDTLTATADSGSVFTGWGGVCSGTASTCKVSGGEKSNIPVIATFDGTGFNGNAWWLTVVLGGSGNGSITGANLSCPGRCAGPVPANATVTLTATPTAGSAFIGWTGPCSGKGACTFVMNEAKDVTALFDVLPMFPLTVAKAGAGTGTVTGPGIDCGTTCSASYPQGTAVTLTAKPAEGSTFDGWSGGCSGTDTCTVTVSAASTVTATFALAPVTLTVRKTGSGKGFVGGASGIDCGPKCNASVVPGTEVSLVASAAPGSRFTGWGGGTGCGKSPACTIRVQVRTILRARFVKSRDTTRPSVHVFPANAKAGASATLRFVASDAGGGPLRSTVTILSGSRILAHLAPQRSTAGAQSSLTWRVPHAPPPRLAFCVQTRDAAGNASKAVCAPIRVA